ncbi:uncharacterized protein ACMZJ9_006766 [Mantella aurantiaca]
MTAQELKSYSDKTEGQSLVPVSEGPLVEIPASSSQEKIPPSGNPEKESESDQRNIENKIIEDTVSATNDVHTTAVNGKSKDSQEESVAHQAMEDNAKSKSHVPDSEQATSMSISLEEAKMAQENKNTESFTLIDQDRIVNLKTKVGSMGDAVVTEDEETKCVTVDGEVQDKDFEPLEPQDDEGVAEPAVIPLLSYEKFKMQSSDETNFGNNSISTTSSDAKTSASKEKVKVSVDIGHAKPETRILTTLGDTFFAIVSGGEHTQDVTYLDGTDSEEVGEDEPSEELEEHKVYLLGMEKSNISENEHLEPHFDEDAVLLEERGLSKLLSAVTGHTSSDTEQKIYLPENTVNTSSANDTPHPEVSTDTESVPDVQDQPEIKNVQDTSEIADSEISEKEESQVPQNNTPLEGSEVKATDIKASGDNKVNFDYSDKPMADDMQKNKDINKDIQESLIDQEEDSASMKSKSKDSQEESVARLVTEENTQSELLDSERATNVGTSQEENIKTKESKNTESFTLIDKDSIVHSKTKISSIDDAVIADDEETRCVTFDGEYKDIDFEPYEPQKVEDFGELSVTPLLTYSGLDMKSTEQTASASNTALDTKMSKLNEEVWFSDGKGHATPIKQEKSIPTTLGDTFYGVVSGGECTQDVTDLDGADSQEEDDEISDWVEEDNILYLLGMEKSNTCKNEHLEPPFDASTFVLEEEGLQETLSDVNEDKSLKPEQKTHITANNLHENTVNMSTADGTPLTKNSTDTDSGQVEPDITDQSEIISLKETSAAETEKVDFEISGKTTEENQKPPNYIPLEGSEIKANDINTSVGSEVNVDHSDMPIPEDMQENKDIKLEDVSRSFSDQELLKQEVSRNEELLSEDSEVKETEIQASGENEVNVDRSEKSMAEDMQENKDIKLEDVRESLLDQKNLKPEESGNEQLLKLSEESNRESPNSDQDQTEEVTLDKRPSLTSGFPEDNKSTGDSVIAKHPGEVENSQVQSLNPIVEETQRLEVDGNDEKGYVEGGKPVVEQTLEKLPVVEDVLVQESTTVDTTLEANKETEHKQLQLSETKDTDNADSLKERSTESTLSNQYLEEIIASDIERRPISVDKEEKDNENVDGFLEDESAKQAREMLSKTEQETNINPKESAESKPNQELSKSAQQNKELSNSGQQNKDTNPQETEDSLQLKKNSVTPTVEEEIVKENNKESSVVVTEDLTEKNYNSDISDTKIEIPEEDGKTNTVDVEHTAETSKVDVQGDISDQTNDKIADLEEGSSLDTDETNKETEHEQLYSSDQEEKRESIHTNSAEGPSESILSNRDFEEKVASDYERPPVTFDKEEKVHEKFDGFQKNENAANAQQAGEMLVVTGKDTNVNPKVCEESEPSQQSNNAFLESSDINQQTQNLIQVSKNSVTETKEQIAEAYVQPMVVSEDLTENNNNSDLSDTKLEIQEREETVTLEVVSEAKTTKEAEQEDISDQTNDKTANLEEDKPLAGGLPEDSILLMTHTVEEASYDENIKALSIMRNYLNEERIAQYIKYLGSDHIFRLEAMLRDIELQLAERVSLQLDHADKPLDQILETSPSNVLDFVESVLNSRDTNHQEKEMSEEEAGLIVDVQDILDRLRQKHSTESDNFLLASGEAKEEQGKNGLFCILLVLLQHGTVFHGNCGFYKYQVIGKHATVILL